MNAARLWIDPLEYQAQLGEAAHTLARAGVTVSIYNHQLCVLDRGLWPFARQSISDWKNGYIEERARCIEKGSMQRFFYVRSPTPKPVH